MTLPPMAKEAGGHERALRRAVQPPHLAVVDCPPGRKPPFWLLSALRAHAKAPYETEFCGKRRGRLNAPRGPGRRQPARAVIEHQKSRTEALRGFLRADCSSMHAADAAQAASSASVLTPPWRVPPPAATARRTTMASTATPETARSGVDSPRYICRFASERSTATASGVRSDARRSIRLSTWE